MSKTTVTRLFIGAIVAAVAGLVVAIATVVAALAGGVIAIGGPSVVSVDGGAFAGMLGWLVIASLVFAAGAVAAVASWIGALLNTYRLDDKTWFVALLILGLLSFGWVAMVAYVVAGPDGRTGGVAERRTATAGRP
jgi:hypothetical protein